MQITILIPVYNDSTSLLLLIGEIELIAKKNPLLKITILIVDDDSNDSSQYTKLEKFKFIRIKYLKLKYNVGNQKAIFIGMLFCQNHNTENLIIMDGDGEDKPQDIMALIERSKEQNESIIVAKRSQRVNSLFFRFMYFFYKLTFRVLTGKKIDFGNFCLMKKQHINKLLSIEHLKNHFAATILKSKILISKIPLARGPRSAGETKMNYESLITHGLNAISVFSKEVIVRIIIFTLLICIILLFCTLITLYLRFFTYIFLGQAATVVGILLTIGLLILSNAVLMSFIYSLKESEYINKKLSYKDYVKINKNILE